MRVEDLIRRLQGRPITSDRLKKAIRHLSSAEDAARFLAVIPDPLKAEARALCQSRGLV